MADTLTRDLLKAGQFVGQAGYIAKILNVNGSGDIALSGDYKGLPSKKAYTTKRVFETYEIVEENGSKEKLKSLIGYDVKSTFNQRDADTYEFDSQWIGADCLLLLAGHYYNRMTAPKKRGWLAVFGKVVEHEEEINSNNGEVPFLFEGKPNNRAIELITGTTPTTGKILYPNIAGIAAPAGIPNGPITILAGGIYKIIDIADS
jgi:hypothetical protein